MIVAAGEELDAARDDVRSMELELLAKNSSNPDPAAARAEADAFNARVADGRTKTAALKAIASIAEDKGKIFSAQAASFRARAKAALMALDH